MDNLTKQLFTNMPREIAFPWRKPMKSMTDFKREINIHNGIDNVYVSIYGANYIVNKIFFDNDYGNQLNDAKMIFEWCTNKGYQVVPIASGRECRTHLYVIVKPELHGAESKIRLLRAHYSIIKSVFGDFKREMTYLPSGKEVSVFRNKDRIISPDPQVCGDVRRIARVPNTLRPPENLNYCTYLPPDEFLDMTDNDVMTHMKSPYTYDYKIDYRSAPNLTDFKYEFDVEPDVGCWTPVASSGTFKMHKPSKYLKRLLRPYVYNHICTIHPADNIRFVATLDLLSIGLEPEEIISGYSGLGWEDFDERTTTKKVLGIAKSFHDGKYKRRWDNDSKKG